jgi:hypothetical protein
MENKINIWDKIDFEDSKDNPLKFLKEQAELLNTKTAQVLEAEVVLTEAFDQESDEMVLIYQFYVYAPFLGNFRVNLFNVVQPNKPYPIHIKDRVTNSDKVSAKDFDDFVKVINAILDKPDVQNLIKSLYTQSTSVDKKTSS